MKVALVHDWLNGMRGGEKCLEVFCELFPHSPIYTLFYDKEKISAKIQLHPIRVSWIDRFPGARKNYRHFLPFFPMAAESFDLSEFDLIVSTSHCAAKGVKKRKDALHLCYCFTPMRYAWGFFDEYFGDKGFFSKMLIKKLMKDLQRWDKNASGRVDHFVGISAYIQQRIFRCYGRQSEVIYPPVDTDFYTPDPSVKREGFYLIVSALVPYKRVDLAVQAFNNSGKPLVIVGDGPEKKKLERSAKANIRFLGWQGDESLRDHYRRAQALIFPGEEDFGIVPVEAQACGCPVIAYGKGGALETVQDRQTGLFFEKLSAASLAEAVDRFEKQVFEASVCRNSSLRFSRPRFKDEVHKMIYRETEKRKILNHA